METDNSEGILYDICCEQSISFIQKCMENYFMQEGIKSYREILGGNEGIHGIKKK